MPIDRRQGLRADTPSDVSVTDNPTPHLMLTRSGGHEARNSRFLSLETRLAHPMLTRSGHRSAIDTATSQLSVHTREQRAYVYLNNSKGCSTRMDPPYIRQSEDSDDWSATKWINAIHQGQTMHTGRKERKGASLKSKDVARGLDPNGGQCLLTRNLSFESAIQTCHVVAQDEMKNDNLITRLEFFWGLKHGRLNIHEPRNLTFMDATLHFLLDNNVLGLVPDKEIVERISTSFKTHRPREDIRALYEGQTTFQYRLLPLTESVQNIHRLHRGRNQNSPARKTRSVRYRYPFANFPILESHVEPHFVIYNIGKKLEGILDKLPCLTAKDSRDANYLGLGNAKEAYNHLTTIRSIYLKWINGKVPLSFTNGTIGKRGVRGGNDGSGDGVAIQGKKGSKRAAPSDFDQPGTLQGSNKSRKHNSRSQATRSSKHATC